ncbi:indian hedgehog protein-like [Cydia amplana]|uniref:indian hedgehog protein-like n=1 Tax=Cydia amplana TaxID=1869771 RepID=UPI002FE54270
MLARLAYEAGFDWVFYESRSYIHCSSREGSHWEHSLHYEGRAVDVTTSDRDRSKYGMLARLAYEAGFDWVFYESRSYIHCSNRGSSHWEHSLHYEGRAVDVTTSDRDRSKYGMLARLAYEAGFDWVFYESRSYIHCSNRGSSHWEHSLHYEGRAVDVTTSDRDRSKYGMLARLAYEAGFDWVFYESRSYIHCSNRGSSHWEHSLHYEGRAVDVTTSDRDRSKYGMLARLAYEAGFDWVFYESRSYIHCSNRGSSHWEHSLHYEGRAVDVTTSDRDRSKYGMLARLAYEAGFDWVFYESRSYIHCSVRTESSSGMGAGCFPGGAVVHTPEGARDIGTLRIGDQVLAADDSGKMVYSEVVTFIDRDPNATRRFIEVTAENGVAITATPSHLLLLAAADGWREAFAGDVRPGDVLLTRGIGSVMRPSRVTHTRPVHKRGVYAPLTKTGTVIVDDALASCYAVVKSHSLAHAAMAPLRWTAGWSADSPRGVHWYASALYYVGDVVLPSSYSYH